MGVKFKTQYEGHCKIHPEHKWGVGDEVFYDGDKKIICINLECYKEQGGSDIQEKKKFQGRKRLTAEEAKGVSKALWAYALEQAMEAYPSVQKGVNAYADAERDKQMKIQANVFYYGMIELMK